jgi:hypothetical protein
MSKTLRARFGDACASQRQRERVSGALRPRRATPRAPPGSRGVAASRGYHAPGDALRSGKGRGFADAGEPAAPVGLAVRPVRRVMPRSTPASLRRTAASNTAAREVRGHRRTLGGGVHGSPGPVDPRNWMGDIRLGGTHSVPGTARCVAPASQRGDPVGRGTAARRRRGRRADPEVRRSERVAVAAHGPAVPPRCWHPPCRFDARNCCPASRCRPRGAADPMPTRGSMPRSASRRIGHHGLRCYCPALSPATASAGTPPFRRAPLPAFCGAGEDRDTAGRSFDRSRGRWIAHSEVSGHEPVRPAEDGS